MNPIDVFMIILATILGCGVGALCLWVLFIAALWIADWFDR